MSINKFDENLNYIKNRLKHITNYDKVKDNMIERICEYLKDDMFHKSISNHMSLDLLNTCCYHIIRSGINNSVYIMMSNYNIVPSVDFKEMILELDSKLICFDIMVFLCDGCRDCCGRISTTNEEKKLFDFTLLEDIINNMVIKSMKVYKEESRNYYCDKAIKGLESYDISDDLDLLQVECLNFLDCMSRSIKYYKDIAIKCNS